MKLFYAVLLCILTSMEGLCQNESILTHFFCDEANGRLSYNDSNCTVLIEQGRLSKYISYDSSIYFDFLKKNLRIQCGNDRQKDCPLVVSFDRTIRIATPSRTVCIDTLPVDTSSIFKGSYLKQGGFDWGTIVLGYDDYRLKYIHFNTKVGRIRISILRRSDSFYQWSFCYQEGPDEKNGGYEFIVQNDINNIPVLIHYFNAYHKNGFYLPGLKNTGVFSEIYEFNNPPKLALVNNDSRLVFSFKKKKSDFKTKLYWCRQLNILYDDFEIYAWNNKFLMKNK